MKITFRLMKFLAPFWSEIIISILLGFGTIAAGIGLLGTSAYLISAAALHPSIAELQVAIVGVRFFGISRAALRYGERLVSHSVNLRLVASLRSWFYDKLIANNLKVTAIFRSGDLLDRMLHNLETLENFYVRVISPYVVFIIITIGASVFIGKYHPIIGWVLACGLVVTGILIPILTILITRGLSKTSLGQYTILSSSVIESLDGLEELTAFGSDSLVVDQIISESNSLSGIQQRLSARIGLASGLAILTFGLTIWGLLRMAIPIVEDGNLTGILLAVIIQIGMASFESANPLPAASQQLVQSIEAGKNLFDFDHENEQMGTTKKPSDDLLRGFVRMDKVSFIPSDGEFGLHDISLELMPGKKVALFGPSGAGKSSIVELLTKISKPDSGKITIGENDYSSLEDYQVRKIFGVVGHGDFLFNNSLKENLLIAKPYASDDELWGALKEIGLDGWVEKLPKKLGTWLGNHGTAISGGELQRIMLARQILLDRPVLVMDEPLISLDHAIKQDLYALVNSRFGERAILWISHEYLFMEDMDEIIYLENGRILERGTHSELMKKHGNYFLAYSTQREIEA